VQLEAAAGKTKTGKIPSMNAIEVRRVIALWARAIGSILKLAPENPRLPKAAVIGRKLPLRSHAQMAWLEKVITNKDGQCSKGFVSNYPPSAT
jgi:hypothetical protein